MEWNEFILVGIMTLWALSLIVNRKIVERRILEVESRIEKLEQHPRSGPASQKSVGPRR